MSEPGGPDAATTAATTDAGEGAPTAESPAELERRAFVKQMATDTVSMAGRIAGFSRIITRSATAAGQAMITELGAMQAAGGEPGVETGGPGAETAPQPPDMAGAMVATADSPGPDPAPTPVPSASDPAPPQPPAPPPAPVRATVTVDAEQAAVLTAATRAIVAVNRAGFAPQLTSATIHWDGEVLRFPTLGWSRRTTQLRADPKIGVLIDDASTGVFLAVSGTAKILEAHHARAAMEPLLKRDTDDPDEAERRWQALVAEDPDRAVIVVELDQILTGRR